VSWNDERQGRMRASCSWSSERAVMLVTAPFAGCPPACRVRQRRHLPLGVATPDLGQARDGWEVPAERVTLAAGGRFFASCPKHEVSTSVEARRLFRETFGKVGRGAPTPGSGFFVSVLRGRLESSLSGGEASRCRPVRQGVSVAHASACWSSVSADATVTWSAAGRAREVGARSLVLRCQGWRATTRRQRPQ